MTTKKLASPQPKVLLITGGSSGIGLATIKTAIPEFDYIYNLDIQPCEYQHPKLSYFSCDVTKAEQVEQIISQICHTHIPTHCLISAGILESNRLENSAIERIQTVVTINLLGALYVLKTVLPYMQKNHYGNIVLVSSDQSVIGKPNNSVYGCTKAALAQLAKSLAVENADYAIRVNSVCPGTIDTPFYRTASENYARKHQLDLQQVRSELAKEQPLGRIGTPEEVAELIRFIFSDQASFMTGATIPIDGGYTAQ